MLKDPIDTPEFLVESLAAKSASLPARSRCEAFAADDLAVLCLVCTTPATRNAAQHLVVAIVSASLDSRRAFLGRLEALLSTIQLKMPKVDVIQSGDATILLAPWIYRGEFRALTASAAVSPQARPDESLSSFSPSLPQPDASATCIDLAVLKQKLCDFVVAFDPSWRQAMRRLTRFEDKLEWAFPMKCKVEESVTSSGVSWEIHFADLDLLERAFGLVDARLNSGKADSLSFCSVQGSMHQETQLPVIRLSAAENSRDVRIEMARLIQGVLVFLDRVTFAAAQQTSFEPTQRIELVA